jgi:hypothetical protein
MTTEIATVDTTGLVSHRTATTAAGLCKELVVKTAMKIQGRRYVQVEGWQAIANAFGCVASARNVERIEGGYRATGQVIRVADGTVLAEAEGFVGDDESLWQKRPVFARRAMAQTRAMSRACRSAFAFVVTLMDAGLETTPAEEMAGVIDVRPEPVTMRTKPAGPATPGDLEQSRLAVNRAKTPAALESMRDTVERRLAEGFYSTAQADELLNLINGRIDIVTAQPEEVTA